MFVQKYLGRITYPNYGISESIIFPGTFQWDIYIYNMLVPRRVLMLNLVMVDPVFPFITVQVALFLPGSWFTVCNMESH